MESGLAHTSPEPWVDEADGVFRGGGVKGIAVAGAIGAMYAHPTKPVRSWRHVAGTSAGAIIAAYLGCGRSPEGIGDFIANTPMASFADFPLGSKVAGGLPNFIVRHGFAHGKKFVEWAQSDLTDHKTFGEIDAGHEGSLKMIAADVTNRRMIVMPDDLAGYNDPDTGKPIVPQEFPVARALRMSMSIPYFFEPVTLDYRLPNKTVRSVIVDGGTLSNFPVWLFDVSDPGVTLVHTPTFGITLTGGRGFGPKLPFMRPMGRLVPYGARLAFSIFHTASEAWDAHFQSHSTRVRSFAPSAGDVATTQFKLPDAKVKELLENGRKAANEFLDQFKLSDYMNTYGKRFDLQSLAGGEQESGARFSSESAPQAETQTTSTAAQ